MCKVIFAFVFVGASFLTAPVVLAVGSGSGGGVPTPSCTADTWDCSNWSACSESGRQTRICTLSFDCPVAETPKPAEKQACTPPAPQPTPKSKTTPSTESPKPKPACSADRWECGAWLPSCDIYGNENRLCRLVFDCPTTETPSPATQKPCSKLQCGNKATPRERIFCRLNLAPAGIARELQIQYLPEECRAIQESGQQNSCLARYKSYQPCWSTPAGETRFACARNVLKLGPVVSDEVKKCQGKTGQDQVACKTAVKEKVFSMIKFRFYDLEERAERLGERGADLGAVADLEATVESKKRDFDAVQTKMERRQIILDVRQAWQEFLNKTKDQIK